MPSLKIKLALKTNMEITSTGSVSDRLKKTEGAATEQPQGRAVCPSKQATALDPVAAHATLAGTHGREYWRSLEELAETPEFQELLHREFPSQASEWTDAASRRDFLKLMGASLALAGLTGCTRQPDEYIAPYTKPVEGLAPGKPLFFATAMTLGGIAQPLLVKSHMGRPIKVEGNPEHPASLGATDAFAQASILSLYDPDRSQTLTHLGEIRPWPTFLGEMQAMIEGKRASKGAGLRFLTETVTSPTLAAQLQSLLAEFPAAKWHQYEPVGRDNVRAGAQLAFGQDINTIYKFENAEVILSLDADFLGSGPGRLRYAREFAAKRRLTEGKREMNRLYVLESTPTITGAKADHRWPMKATEIAGFAFAVAASLGAQSGSDSASWRTIFKFDSSDQSLAKRLTVLTTELQQHRGKSLVIVGDHQPPAVHALAHGMNQSLGNVGSTVIHTASLEANPVNQMASLSELVKDMNAGAVDTLIIIGGNPVYNVPADLKFREALSQVRLRVHLSLYNDETSELCHWHIPEAHYLESWGDARAYDGTVTLMQPLIASLYHGKSSYELLAAFSKQPERSGRDIIRDYWRGARPSGDFEQFWRKALHDGFITNTALSPKTGMSEAHLVLALYAATRGSDGNALPGSINAGGTPALSGMEVIFQTDPAIHDGRFANNGWLQELPKPLTKLTWDNVALISPATATKLGLASTEHPEQANGKVIELSYQNRKMRAPVWVMPGKPDDSITVQLGYGRWRAGHVGTGLGSNAYDLRTSTAPWFATGIEVKDTGERYALACMQMQQSLEGLEDRHIIRTATLEEYQKTPDFAHHEAHTPSKELSLYPGFKYDGYAWGMAIDQQSCVGCNACVVACQAENNIPIVGKQQVINGRIMHWLRIDTYFKGALTNPETHFQPMLCQHCENAPCEVVCPVNATNHDAEGLNTMVYNRCVGTRYCSDNCPYKVRRFNFLLYGDWNTPTLKMLRNPEVSVRSRGVMEKCTYCVQRIMHAKIEAEKEDRTVRDGEVVTACQAVCPAQAIVFGDINDPKSRVAKLKAEPRNYGVLAELNTQPRTTYLASVRNPNKEIEHA